MGCGKPPQKRKIRGGKPFFKKKVTKRAVISLLPCYLNMDLYRILIHDLTVAMDSVTCILLVFGFFFNITFIVLRSISVIVVTPDRNFQVIS